MNQKSEQISLVDVSMDVNAKATLLKRLGAYYMQNKHMERF